MSLQNTYRTSPKIPFNQEKCDFTLKSVIDGAMEEYQYNARTAPSICTGLAEEIKRNIKEFEFDRFKLICTVTIGERYLQSFESAAKFLWDADKDGYSSYTFDTPQFFCTATVFAVYLD